MDELPALRGRLLCALDDVDRPHLFVLADGVEKEEYPPNVGRELECPRDLQLAAMRSISKKYLSC
ncbi:MAG: hypothetical protein AABZ47_12120 [Planctomycetota bacterium]